MIILGINGFLIWILKPHWVSRSIVVWNNSLLNSFHLRLCIRMFLLLYSCQPSINKIRITQVFSALVCPHVTVHIQKVSIGIVGYRIVLEISCGGLNAGAVPKTENMPLFPARLVYSDLTNRLARS